MSEPDSKLEELALIIEALLDDLRRRGVDIDIDLSSYEEYRAQHPRKDA
jgi:hypothetical protein